MEIYFKLCKHGECGVQLTDMTLYSTTPSENFRDFTLEESKVLNVLIPINSDESEGVPSYSISESTNIMEFLKDGLYKVLHIILPNENWLIRYLDSAILLNLYEYIYIYNTQELLIQKYDRIKKILEPVEIDEILALNSNVNSTICSDYKHTFCLCRLLKCFYKYCLEYLSKLCSDSCNTKSIETRDLLWITLSTIKYMLELDKFYEALRLVETITKCTGLCPLAYNKGGNSCGCGK